MGVNLFFGAVVMGVNLLIDLLYPYLDPRIQLLGLGSDACDRMLAPLIKELNATRTIYPGTELRLVYEVAGDPPPESVT